jgi:hypothetical protein
MNEDELRESIKELAGMDVELNKKGGPSRAGKLYERILVKEKDLLTKLDLPNNKYYQRFLHFDSIPWDKEIDDRIKLLFQEIEKRKNMNKETDLEKLIYARKANRDPEIILPQLGIETHVYTIFVYKNILMHNQDEPENVLSELKLVNNSDLLDITGKMKFSSDWLENAEEQIASLEKKGLKYIRQYALDIINFLKSMGFKVNGF